MTSPGADQVPALTRAAAMCDLGRFADAARLLTPVLAQYPDDPDAWCLLAQAQLGLSEPAAALRSAQSAMTIRPDEEWAHRLRSIALIKLDRSDEAVSAASAAVRLAPHQWQTHRSLADALTHAKDRPAESIEAATQAVTLAPHEPGAFFSLGVAAAAAGHGEQARDAFGQALALDPQHSGAHNELARLHLGRRGSPSPKHLAAALSGFATALRAHPDTAVARSNLDLSLRVFLARLYNLIFLAAFVAYTLNYDPPSNVGRVVTAVFVALPVIYATRFRWRLSPPLRRRLAAMATGRGLRLAAAAEAVAAVGVASTALTTAGPRFALGMLSVGCALVGRVLVQLEVRDQAKPRPDDLRRHSTLKSAGRRALVILVSVALTALIVTPDAALIWIGFAAWLTAVNFFGRRRRIAGRNTR